MRRRSSHTFFTVLFAITLHGTAAGAATLATSGDASISQDTAAGTWTLRAGGAALTLAVDRSRDFQLVSLVSPSGQKWAGGSVPDSSVHVGSRTLPFGNRADGFALENAAVTTRGNLLQLDATYTLASANLTLTRHYAIVSGSPSIETWTTYTAVSAALSDLNAIQLVIPAGTIHWLTGLEGDTAGAPDPSIPDTAFTLMQQAPAIGQRLTFGAAHRASEQTVPWFAVDGATSESSSVRGGDEFYMALMWSGAWTATFDRTAAGLQLAIGLPAMTTTVEQATDGPHLVFGAAGGGMPGASSALRSFIFDGIRAGRPITPLVTYNTWFAYGTEIDADSMRAEMTRVAALGAELFVVDAGWYANTGIAGPYDFDAGLGSWTADPARFPDGLRPLRDYAHDLGMQFGLWVEPERVGLALVGAPAVDESWLATTGGSYGSDDAAQICLASAAARAWLLDRLTALIDDVQPDYIKWDNNMMINCDRSGHGHGTSDGNFAHISGLYDLLGALRARYPDLLIENVSGGGNRLDIGMLRYSDAGWMDDRTAPASHVRHNLEGLSAVFPPAYLLSFVTDHSGGGEPLHDAPDLSLYFRSRMSGALGLCFLSDGLVEGDEQAISREIAIYKEMRGTISVAVAALLTAQAETTDPPPWDALQESATDGGQLVITAFQSDDGVSRFTVTPSGLHEDFTYQVQSVDTGVLGAATGAELMQNGIELVQSPNSAAHVLIITRQ
ncbi:MAG TPA: glycoside hydrolase family 36 protein [Vicinamibacterales bacterium]|nr:glycoside hydrolase family 36 protein [Vicinamibacterales bacterium]